MKLKDISRTATFAWDQSSSSTPLLATGAVAGALDESFSNESQLEIWSPQFGDGEGLYLGGQGSSPEGSITVNSRFNRLAWSAPTASLSRGVLAAGMETGEINVFDPAKILSGESADGARIFANSKHTGPVRGLDFNPIQKNLLLSGGVNAELFIFDLNNPTNPIPPGSPSTKLGEITSLQWNPTVSRIFAASSSSGFTSVWDLRTQKEIASLQYGGGAAKGMGTIGGVAGLQMGKRRGMSDVAWHPENTTQLITASEDDESPIIMLWDLRNTRAPERILSGHHKGVLSVSWCKQDSDLLLSTGKDNRTLVWNPQSGEVIGELPPSSDWSFQTAWCPRNPDLLATASFDGHIGIHSLQSTQEPEQPAQRFSESATADDVFSGLANQTPADQTADVLSLKQPPKWLRRPVSATFGFGGLLASTSNLPGASGQHQSGVVHLRKIVTEQDIIDRAQRFSEKSGDLGQLEQFCNERAEGKTETAWKTLQTLFKANSKQELIELLGFRKEDVAKQVEEAIKKFPSFKADETTKDDSPAAVSDDASAQDGSKTPTKSELAVSDVGADASEESKASADAHSSLFDDDAPGTPGGQATDFFSSMAAGALRNPQLDHIVPHKSQAAESSIAATAGSRPSSVRSEVIKDDTFHIYPEGEGEVDKLITQALVLGDFASAVDLCLASERFADALLLAVRGGPELLQSTQKAYFARRTTSLPFLRVFQSIVTEDLADIVQNAELDEWKVVFVVLCTYAKDGEFNNLTDQLGQRLQYKAKLLSSSDSPESKASAKVARENATLCYLASRRLEKVVGIWIEELREEEQSSSEPLYTAHAHALQSFIEKVSVFTAATNYVDEDLAIPTESPEAAQMGARTYRLAGLYDRYYEYADLLATQGLVELAATYVQKTPSDYKGTGVAGAELDKARDRLFRAAGLSETRAQSSSIKPLVAESTSRARPHVPSAYIPPHPTSAYAAPAASSPYAPAPSSYQAPQMPQQQQQPKAQPSTQPFGYNQPTAYTPQTSYQPTSSTAYAPSGAYGSPEPQAQGYGAPSAYGASAAPQTLAPPPRAGHLTNGSTATPPPIPAAQRRDMPGWNDAPNFAPPKRPQSAAKETPKPAPITSPFPQTHIEPVPGQAFPSNIHGNTPPPPRAGQPGLLPPPPKGGPRPPSAQALAKSTAGQPTAPPQAVRPPPSHFAGPPPSNLSTPTSPPAAGPPPRGSSRGGPPPGVQGPPGVLAGPPPRALSPLGPQGRSAPLTAALQAAASPPPSHPPAAQQVRAAAPSAGAPPRARQTSISQPIQPITSPSSTPPPPAAPVSKPSHPAGDRSHIPATAKPIYDVLNNELQRIKQLNLPPAIKRIADDTDRRLNILFDQLNNDAIPASVVGQLSGISNAISAKNSSGALALHVELLTSATGDMSAWVPGVKQLIRLGV